MLRMAACSDSPIRAAWRAGFTIVFLAACERTGQNDAPNTSGNASEWRLDSIPSLQIGADGSPEYEFSNVVAFGRLSSGHWYLFDHGSNELRYYDDHGLFIRKVGRSGEGPGEFRYVHHATAMPDDRIWIYDSILRRLTEVSAEGRIKRIVRVPDQPMESTVLQPVGFLDDETVVWSSYRIPPCTDGVTLVDTITYYRYTLPSARNFRGGARPGDTSELVAITRNLGAHRWGNSINVLRICGATLIPFTGVPVARIHSGSLHLANADKREIRILDSQTGDERILSYRAARREVTQEMISAFIETAVGTTPRDERGRPLDVADGMRLYARRLSETPYPDSLPLAGQLVVDVEGFIWVGSYPTTEFEPTRWSVIAPDGTGQYELVLPARYRVFEIGVDYVAGIALDTYDVQRAVVYRLTRAGVRVPNR